MLTVALVLTSVILPLQASCEEPAEAEVLGRATRGASGFPRLELLGAPIKDRPFGFVVTNARPGSVGFLILGAEVLPRPLSVYGAVQFPAGGLWNVPFAVDDGGTSGPIGLSGLVPMALCGSELVAQAFLADPQAQGGLAFTRAARVRFGAAAERPLFPGTLLPLGNGRPASVAAGDFDADGHVDLVATTSVPGGTSASVLFGSRGGVFGDAIALAAPMAAGVASADLDDDGFDDLVVGNVLLSAGTISVHLSRGDRTFDAPLPTQVGFQPVTVLTGDLDGDGDADVLAQSSFGQGRLLLGLGDGTFTQGPFSPSYTLEAVLDMDGDGILDLVGKTFTTIVVARGLGGATFAAPLMSPSGGSSFELDVGDFDADGVPDVGIAFLNDPEVAVLLGVGDGTFSAPLPRASGFNDLVTVGDVDGDGLGDLVVLRLDEAKFFHGNGDGTLSAARVFAAQRSAVDALATDLDGDGRDDIAVLNEIVTPYIGIVFAELHVLLATGDGVLSTPLANAVGQQSSVVLADWDGDQVLDFASAAFGSIHSAKGLGRGRFAPALTLANEGWGKLATADLDGDGDLDLVCGDNPSGAVLVLLGDGHGGFGPAASFPAVVHAWQPAIADLDGDGFLDVVALGVHFTGLDNQVALLFGRGDGTFEPPKILTVGTRSNSLVVEDFTGDALPDLAIVHVLQAEIQIWRGGSGRTFTLHGRVDLPKTPRFLAAEDIDADGILDLVVVKQAFQAGNALPGSVLVLEGLGDGSFELRETVDIGPIASALNFNMEAALADFDRDGRIDIAACTQRGVEVLHGRGGLSFDPPRIYFGASLGVEAIAVGDVDGDFLPDLVGADSNESSVRVFRNQLLHDAPATLMPAESVVGPKAGLPQ